MQSSLSAFSMSVCLLSAIVYLKKTTRLNFIKYSLHVIPVVLARLSRLTTVQYTLCTSGYVNDVTFSHNGQEKVTQIWRIFETTHRRAPSRAKSDVRLFYWHGGLSESSTLGKVHIDQGQRSKFKVTEERSFSAECEILKTTSGNVEVDAVNKISNNSRRMIDVTLSEGFNLPIDLRKVKIVIVETPVVFLQMCVIGIFVGLFARNQGKLRCENVDRGCIGVVWKYWVNLQF